jgi:hypothetical protein
MTQTCTENWSGATERGLCLIPVAQARYFVLTAEFTSLSIGAQHIGNPNDTSRYRPNPSRQLSQTAIFDRSTSSLEGLW